MSDKTRDNDLALAPNEQAFIMDMTKGEINTWNGPIKTSLAGTDVAVIFDEDSKSFTKVSLFEATQLHRVAPEGWYVTLYNPEPHGKHPTAGRSNTPELNVGHKIHIPGPCSMPLWPGQMARVVKGHHLRQNQYLLIRVYNEKAARESLDDAVVMTASDEASTDSVKKKLKKATSLSLSESLGINPNDLTPGKQFVIKGTEVSFFIPPTGIEVVHDGADFVRNAVTLERLEYCLLVDQQGTKRYVRGPKVVFPTPTESFRSKTENKKRSRKFKAIELNPNSGLYIKVIADYTEGKESFKQGQELFLTGKDTPLYFPREEHSLIKYGNQEIHHGVAIPPGEGRYVLQRMTGEIELVKGPQIYLADPRTHVITRRVLDPKVCELLYPGNTEALGHNVALVAQAEELEALVAAASPELKTSGAALRRARNASYTVSSSDAHLYENLGKGFQGDALDRNTAFTAPRTVTLDNKYDGAVSIDIWDGYAVQFVSKTGGRRVVNGPTTVLLQYDETPGVLKLSTGKPKSTSRFLKTAYLRINHNHTTDVVSAETSDFCNVDLTLCYRVNFEGKDTAKWFSIENYVKYLCDHMRSMIRNHVKSMTIADFHANAANIVRDLILGKNVKGSRAGKLFTENNMRIYDVEVLEVNVDKDIQKLLVGQQRDVFTQNLKLTTARRNLSFSKEMEGLAREQATAVNETQRLRNDLERQTIEDNAKTGNLQTQLNTAASRQREQDRISLDNQTNDARLDQDRKNTEANVAMQELLDAVALAERTRVHTDATQKLVTRKEYHALDMDKMQQEAIATAKKADAINDKLIAAIQQVGDAKLIGEVTRAIQGANVMTAFGAEDLTATLGKILGGTEIGKKLLNGSNGAATKKPATRARASK